MSPWRALVTRARGRSALLGSYRLNINHGYLQGVELGIVFTSFFILFLNLPKNELIMLERPEPDRGVVARHHECTKCY